MKPKTILQKEVFSIHKKLPINKKSIEKFMQSKHGFFYTTHYNKLVCLECGHIWKGDFTGKDWKNKIVGIDCPSCKRKLELEPYKNSSFMESAKLTFIEALSFGEFQVFRFYRSYKHFKKGKAATYSVFSLFEEWTTYNGKEPKKVIIGRYSSMGSYELFNAGDYEVRQNSSRGWGPNYYENFVADFNLPNPQFIERFSCFNLENSEEFDCDYRRLLNKMISSNEIETIYKAGMKDVLFHSIHKDFNYYNYWPQIKMMIRHKPKIPDLQIWKDYMYLIKHFKKDTMNPSVIFPEDISKAHNDLTRRKTILDERERIQAERRREIMMQEEAEKEAIFKNLKKSSFKNLKFKSNNLVIVPILSAQTLKKESKLLDHCAYNNKYHKKSGSLLLSARVDEEPVETIEVSLKEFDVIQSRGYDNAPSPYHDQILNLMKHNIHKIEKIATKALSKINQ